MYKILYKDNLTNVEYWEYGFARHIAKRLTDLIGNSNYEVIWCIKIIFTKDTFIKCLKKIIQPKKTIDK